MITRRQLFIGTAAAVAAGTAVAKLPPSKVELNRQYGPIGRDGDVLMNTKTGVNWTQVDRNFVYVCYHERDLRMLGVDNAREIMYNGVREGDTWWVKVAVRKFPEPDTGRVTIYGGSRFSYAAQTIISPDLEFLKNRFDESPSVHLATLSALATKEKVQLQGYWSKS